MRAHTELQHPGAARNTGDDDNGGGEADGDDDGNDEEDYSADGPGSNV